MITALPEAIEVDVDEWLVDQVGPAVKTLVTDHPWAQTYRVAAADRIYYLKVLPEAQRGGLRASSELGRKFAGTVPQTVAYDVERGFVLLLDHGGRDIGS